MNANITLLSISQIGFALLSVVYLWLFMLELKRGVERTAWNESAKKKFFFRTLAGIVIWMAFVSLWSASGMMGKFERFPINVASIIIIPLIAVVAFPVYKKSWRSTPEHSGRKYHHASRLSVFIELLLWALFAAHILPAQMIFEGRNFDVLAGITAPFISWFVSRGKLSRMALMLWNIVCLALLINIVTIAILSTPVAMEGVYE